MFDKIINLGDLENTIKKAAGLKEADQLVKTSSSTFEKGKKMISVINNPQAGMAACCWWMTFYWPSNNQRVAYFWDKIYWFYFSPNIF